MNFSPTLGNGLDERFNQTLQNMLVKYIIDKKEQWDQFLDMCIYAYNTSQHDSNHFSPYEIMLGRKAVLPIDLDTCRDAAATLLQQFNSAPRFSPSVVESAVAYRAKLLQSAKENILNTQENKRRTMTESTANLVLMTQEHKYCCGILPDERESTERWI